MITKLGVTLSLAILFAPPCVAQDAASQKFLKEAIEGNFAEEAHGGSPFLVGKSLLIRFARNDFDILGSVMACEICACA